MKFSKEQEKQILLQLEHHKHNDYKVDIRLDEKEVLKNLIVLSKVFRSDKMSALYLAKWLFFNNGKYSDKTVIDMGCGPGIQGIVAGLYGAKKVIFSDLSSDAVKNTKENVKQYGLNKKSVVVSGDLYENIKEKADVIIFNHPFFSDTTIEKLLVLKTMVERGKLIHQFLGDSKAHLNKGGVIIMPYFHLAGPVNNPEVQAPKHGYNVEIAFRINAKVGLQKGLFSIFELSL